MCYTRYIKSLTTYSIRVVISILGYININAVVLGCHMFPSLSVFTSLHAVKGKYHVFSVKTSLPKSQQMMQFKKQLLACRHLGSYEEKNHPWETRLKVTWDWACASQQGRDVCLRKRKAEAENCKLFEHEKALAKILMCSKA